MIFNSWEFILFFLVLYSIYIALPHYRLQNYLLILGSYLFYAAWDWRFCFLLFGITVINYYGGAKISSSLSHRNKRIFLVGCIIVNLGVLCLFKYYNFFLDSLDSLVSIFGLSVTKLHLNIVLPIGISFYTFMVMTYIIDIYRGELKPSKKFLDFALCIAFFPHLLSGPISRAKQLLPQIGRKRALNLRGFESGCWLILWGLYKKIFIADNLMPLVEQVFYNSSSVSVLETYLGALAFTIQIYCDFSGYTDIARGCARLLGFELMRNFNLPYFAKDPREFWKRWHISLSTWLRDYLYIPLGGNKKGEVRTYLNLFLTMILGGLWHGASWNFVLWGGYHGLLLIGHRVLMQVKHSADERLTPWIQFGKGFAMFQFAVFGWLLFRSNRSLLDGRWFHDDSLNQIAELLLSYRNGFGLNANSLELFLNIFLFTVPLAFIQWFQFRHKNHYFMLESFPLTAKATLFAFLAFTWLMWGVQSGESFIYFQF